MQVSLVRTPAVASTTSSSTGTGQAAFAELVPASARPNGLGAYNQSIAEMNAYNQRMLEAQRATHGGGGGGSSLSAYNTSIAEQSAQNQRLLESARAQGIGLFAGAGTNGLGQYSTSLSEMSAQMSEMLGVQIAMMRENLMFTSISNILKTKHDTLKTIVGNIR